MTDITDFTKRALSSVMVTEPEPTAKRAKTVDARDVPTGVAPVKPEYIIQRSEESVSAAGGDDAAKAPRTVERYRSGGGGGAGGGGGGGGKAAKKKQRGQNKARKFHYADDEVKLCQSLVHVRRESEFADTVCEYAANAPLKGGKDMQAAEEVPDRTTMKCRFEHNLRTYLQHKSPDLDGVCAVYQSRGVCASGWRCKWLSTHTKEENGELLLVIDENQKRGAEEKAAQFHAAKVAASKSSIGSASSQDWEESIPVGGFDDPYGEIVNNVPTSLKISIRKNQIPLKMSEVFQAWANEARDFEENRDEHRAEFREPPPRPEEKRRLYISRDTPLLAPLTTTGNLPFRRLCVSMGACITYSEMALSTSLLQGHKPEYALLRAHTSELPHFGAQICANKLTTAIRSTEILTHLFPTASSSRHGLALIDLNCGCPIDLVYKSGGGSALLDQQNKLAKILRGMNYVSGATPITVKIRMGTKDSAPSAQKLASKLLEQGSVQAITLHGRSRQQRYSRAADWGYIAATAALISRVKKELSDAVDTAEYKDRSEPLPTWFVGNGDCYSHLDYYNAIDSAGVDGVMVARGALIKPWIFEEINSGQYLDKSATERLEMIREYCKMGLETWGSDELGVATTRKFLLEWLSFTSRYVPIGILERLPARLNDRPPFWRGRNELETLLGSADSRDWIKISEMFLGKCPENFFFTPKHKSSSYDQEAEG